MLNQAAFPDYSLAENLIFNPFGDNLDEDTFDDIDPDKNFYNTYHTKPCKYLHTDAINNILDTSKDLASFSIFHMNIRSVKFFFYHLEAYLSMINHKFSVIALTETWLKAHNFDLYPIDGYNLLSSTRETKPGGGIAIYIKDCLKFKLRPDLNYADDNLEMLWAEIDNTN
jgi:hypothetical protein